MVRKIQRSQSRTLKSDIVMETDHTLSSFNSHVQDRKHRKCVSPQTISLDISLNEPTRIVLRSIDEFVWRAMVLKPQFFNYIGASLPRLYPNALRGFWLGCFQYYMWRIKCVNVDYTLPVSYGPMKIPVGLAKIFQQFAPYLDSSTGSEFRHFVNLYDPLLFGTYPSVDMRTASGFVTGVLGDALVHLNSPVDRFLICATDKGGTTTDYLSAYGMAALSSGPTTSVLWSSWFADSDHYPMLRSFQNLFEANISVDEIPVYAPDCSSYGFYTSHSTFSPAPVFDPSMVLICTTLYGDGGNTPDRDINYFFDSGWPTIRNPCRTVDTEVSSYVLVKTLRQVYACLTAHSEGWEPGPAISLMTRAGNFSGVKEFSYRRSEMSEFRLASAIVQCLETDSWLGTSQDIVNSMFAFAQLAYSAYYQRMFEWVSIPHAEDEQYPPPYSVGFTYPVAPCFWAESSVVTMAKFPSTLAKVLSSIGPVIIEGKVVFPYTQVNSFWNTTLGKLQGDPTIPGGWTSAIQTNGIWRPQGIEYGLTSSPILPMSLTYPAQTRVFTWAVESLIIGASTVPCNYGVNLAYAQAFVGEYYQNRMPLTFGTDRWTVLSDIDLGELTLMTTRLIGEAPALGVVFQNSYFFTNYVIVYKTASTNLCRTNSDLVNGAMFGLTVLQSSILFGEMRQLAIDFGPTFEDPIRSIQLRLNSSESSQYQQNLRALTQVNSIHSAFGSSNKILNDNVKDVIPGLIYNSVPDYTSYQTWADNARRVAVRVAEGGTNLLLKHVIIPKILRFISQNLYGDREFGQEHYLMEL